MYNNRRKHSTRTLRWRTSTKRARRDIRDEVKWIELGLLVDTSMVRLDVYSAFYLFRQIINTARKAKWKWPTVVYPQRICGADASGALNSTNFFSKKF